MNVISKTRLDMQEIRKEIIISHKVVYEEMKETFEMYNDYCFNSRVVNYKIIEIEENDIQDRNLKYLFRVNRNLTYEEMERIVNAYLKGGCNL